MTKAETRRELLLLRKEIADREEKDHNIFEKLIPMLAAADPVLTYVSTAGEVDTLGILSYLFLTQKAVLVPKCTGLAMRFHRITCFEDLAPGVFGILEPGEQCPTANIPRGALCLVPGLTFTPSGDRLGYGKGYYDRFLRENSVKSIGLCYNELIRASLPTESFDEKVSVIVTDQFIQEVPYVR